MRIRTIRKLLKEFLISLGIAILCSAFIWSIMYTFSETWGEGELSKSIVKLFGLL